MKSLGEAIFGMYISNLCCTVKGIYPFVKGNSDEKSKKRLNDFNCSVRRILANKKALLGDGGEYISFDGKERRLQQLCDEIMEIILSRKKDLKEIKIKGDGEYLLFLDQIFDFFLSEKNLPSFINLIYGLVNGGSIFTKEGDYEKNLEWLDSFEFKV